MKLLQHLDLVSISTDLLSHAGLNCNGPFEQHLTEFLMIFQSYVHNWIFYIALVTCKRKICIFCVMVLFNNNSVTINNNSNL